MAENEQDPALTCPPLPLERILGYNGKVKNGLHIVEGEKYPSILFPLGSACIKERSKCVRRRFDHGTLIDWPCLWRAIFGPAIFDLDKRKA